MRARRWGKRILIGLVAVIVLLFVLVAGALALVDSAAVKRVVAERVEASTGRKLTIGGDLGISLFPWVGFELGPTRLANAAGFGERPFVALERAELRVRVLPLLWRRVAVDRVVLHGLDVNLARAAGGRGNWEDLLPEEPPGSGAGEPSGQPATGQDEGGASGIALRVEGIELRDANLHWRDAASGRSLTVRDLNLETGVLAPGVATPVRLSVKLEPDAAPSLAIDLQTEATFEPGASRLRLAGLAVELTADGDGLPGGELSALVGGDLDADLAAGRVRVDQLEVTLDDTRATGSLRLQAGDIPEAGLRLAVDTVDLDRYLPVAGGGESKAAAGAAAGGTGAAGDPVASLPLDTLRGVRADAAIDVGRLRVRGLDARDVALRARLDDGLLTLERLSAGLAQGSLRLDGRLDGRTDTPATAVNIDIKGIQAEPLLRALTGTVPVSGRLDAGIDLDTAGATLDEWIGALDGSLATTFSDGAIEGINIARRIRVAWARVQGEQVEAAAEQRRTDFSRLHFAADVRDGVMRSDTLDLRAPLLRVGGSGKLDLARREVDYVARVLVTGTLEGQGGAGGDKLKGLEIPLRIRGPLAGPKVELAMGDALEARARAKKEELKREAREAEQKAQKEIDEAVEKEKRELERKKKKEKKKAKEKLEQELKGLFD